MSDDDRSNQLCLQNALSHLNYNKFINDIIQSSNDDYNVFFI